MVGEGLIRVSAGRWDEYAFQGAQPHACTRQDQPTALEGAIALHSFHTLLSIITSSPEATNKHTAQMKTLGMASKYPSSQVPTPFSQTLHVQKFWNCY